jgi:hypothetical protein
MSRPAMGPNQPPVQGTLCKVVFPPDGIFAGREADHTPPSSAEVKNSREAAP